MRMKLTWSDLPLENYWPVPCLDSVEVQEREDWMAGDQGVIGCWDESKKEERQFSLFLFGPSVSLHHVTVGNLH